MSVAKEDQFDAFSPPKIQKIFLVNRQKKFVPEGDDQYEVSKSAASVTSNSNSDAKAPTIKVTEAKIPGVRLHKVGRIA